jgi:5-methyltetrahydropteroyltriglutamate--homocysteine methyltransferase
MTRDANRILTTHAGSLPRSDELKRLVYARADGHTYNLTALSKHLKDEVGEVVRKQVECGIDSINDGEVSKTNFTNYVRERLAGFEARPFGTGKAPKPLSIAGRELKKFPEYFAAGGRGFGAFAGSGPSQAQVYCVGPLKYAGHAALKDDIANFKAALQGVKPVEAFLPANTPGTIEHWLRNEHYPSQEAFRTASRTRCARNTRRSWMRASCSRSTTRTCRTAGRCFPR